MDRALPTLKTCADQIRLHQTLLHVHLIVYISNHIKIAPSQHLEKEGKLIAKLCPALLPKKLRLRGDKVAQQLPGGCQTSWSWTKVLSKLANNIIIDCSNFILQRNITIWMSSHPKFSIRSCLHSGKWRTGLWGKPVEVGIEEGSIQVGPMYISSKHWSQEYATMTSDVYKRCSGCSYLAT